MPKKVIIFDFDGVLADSFDTFYFLIKDAMAHIGIKISPSQYRNFFITNVHQSFKDFIKNDKKFVLFSEFRNKNYDKYYDAKLFPKAEKLIRLLSKKYILTIASSGKKTNIKKLLKKNGIENLFYLILADSKFSKADMINKILRKYKSKPEKSTMVTDTVGDINVAKSIGLKTIAVTWGFHSKKTLLKSNPDLVIDNFESLTNFDF